MSSAAVADVIKVASAEALPFFVYGTLMVSVLATEYLQRAERQCDQTGFYNHERCLKPYLSHWHSARVNHAELYTLGPYPGLLLTSKPTSVLGQLAYIKPGMYAEALDQMDMLEDFIDFGKHNVVSLNHEKLKV